MKGEVQNFAGFVLQNCEKNEGLQKLYSYHTLDSVMTRIKKIEDNTWFQKVTKQLIKNFEYPLHSVSSCCEGIVKKMLSLLSSEQISKFHSMVASMKSRHEIKSRFLALNLALEYTDIRSYHKENPDAITEMISHTSEAPVIGKYVMSYFEGYLNKLWRAVGEKPQDWYAFWTDQYLAALKSPDDSLR